MIKIIGPIQKYFEEYKKYRENTTKMLFDVNEAVKDKQGFTTNDLIKTLNEEN